MLGLVFGRGSFRVGRALTGVVSLVDMDRDVVMGGLRGVLKTKGVR